MKIDLTDGAFTSADSEDRWKSHAQVINDLRLAGAAPAMQRKAAGYRFEYWIDRSEIAIPWHIAAFDGGGLLVGFLAFSQRGGVLLANEVAVKKTYRREGIATAMYDFGEYATQLKFVPSTQRSPYAAAFWASRHATEMPDDQRQV
jgi:Acetyltransferase (GNAT) family